MIKTYGTKSVWLKSLNILNKFLTGWFIKPRYITLPVYEDIKDLDSNDEEN